MSYRCVFSCFASMICKVKSYCSSYFFSYFKVLLSYFIIQNSKPTHLRTLLNMMWQPAWEGFEGRMDTCVSVAESFRCSPETSTAVWNHVPGQNKSLSLFFKVQFDEFGKCIITTKKLPSGTDSVTCRFQCRTKMWVRLFKCY